MKLVIATASLFLVATAGCGAGTDDMLFGGITSSGNKPKRESERTDDADEAQAQVGTQPAADSEESKTPLSPSATACASGPDLEGTTWSANAAIDGAECSQRSAVAREPRCLESLTFEKGHTVRMRYAGENPKGVVTSYAQCGSRLYVGVDKAQGESGVDVQEFLVDGEASRMMHAGTGASFTKQP